ncbi:hypothetical protein ABT266_43745, partial [Amycolatopsis sp. NPDC000746]|uniref:hypothetical protein n=1 Tax=Amycolatopsis sp. NPDC000746 TaxID=3154270 RepID=UPI00331A124D
KLVTEEAVVWNSGEERHEAGSPNTVGVYALGRNPRRRSRRPRRRPSQQPGTRCPPRAVVGAGG